MFFQLRHCESDHIFLVWISRNFLCQTFFSRINCSRNDICSVLGLSYNFQTIVSRSDVFFGINAVYHKVNAKPLASLEQQGGRLNRPFLEQIFHWGKISTVDLFIPTILIRQDLFKTVWASKIEQIYIAGVSNYCVSLMVSSAMQVAIFKGDPMN